MSPLHRICDDLAGWMRLLPLLGALAVLTACATQTPPDLPREALFQDARFEPVAVPDGASLFAPSPAMREFAERELSRAVLRKGPTRALMDALYRNGNLRIDYDATQTRNASDTFTEGAGNCLSLAIMTAALAKQLDLPVVYHEVMLNREVWTRASNTYFRIGHVNVTVGDTISQRATRFYYDPALTVDFTPPEFRGTQDKQDIPETRILAMFYNNRAAELLVGGQIDAAYWHARAAISSDPRFESSYNTLGVVYKRKGLQAAAEQLYRGLLARHPDDPTLLSNLIAVLHQLGKVEEAAHTQAKLNRIADAMPFKALLQGQAALAEQQYELAIRFFQQELQRDPDYHETHLGLALAYYHLGKLKAASLHMDKARSNAESTADRIRYAGKLAALQRIKERPGG